MACARVSDGCGGIGVSAPVEVRMRAVFYFVYCESYNSHVGGAWMERAHNILHNLR